MPLHQTGMTTTINIARIYSPAGLERYKDALIECMIKEAHWYIKRPDLAPLGMEKDRKEYYLQTVIIILSI